MGEMGTSDRVAAEADEPPAPPFDPWVCPRCLGENTPLENLCVHCGAPVYGIATTGPLETGISQGWAMGAAVERRRPTWVVALGGFALLSVFLLPIPVFLAGGLLSASETSATTAETVGLVALGAACFGLWLVTVARLARNLRSALPETASEDDEPA
jgi:hypothetical protein